MIRSGLHFSFLVLLALSAAPAEAAKSLEIPVLHASVRDSFGGAVPAMTLTVSVLRYRETHPPGGALGFGWGDMNLTLFNTGWLKKSDYWKSDLVFSSAASTEKDGSAKLSGGKASLSAKNLKKGEYYYRLQSARLTGDQFKGYGFCPVDRGLFWKWKSLNPQLPLFKSGQFSDGSRTHAISEALSSRVEKVEAESFEGILPITATQAASIPTELKIELTATDPKNKQVISFNESIQKIKEACDVECAKLSGQAEGSLSWPNSCEQKAYAAALSKIWKDFTGKPLSDKGVNALIEGGSYSETSGHSIGISIPRKQKESK